jgi:hypothetical protein
MSEELQGKAAVVTGGGTGIGRAISMLLAAKGASVVIVYSRSEQDAVETATAINSIGGHAVTRKADVANEKQVDGVIVDAVSTFGGLDCCDGSDAFKCGVNDRPNRQSREWPNALNSVTSRSFRNRRPNAKRSRRPLRLRRHAYVDNPFGNRIELMEP